MTTQLKLDKWPEEIEYDGWRWKHGSRHYVCDTGQCTVQYVRAEKLHVPSTQKAPSDLSDLPERVTLNGETYGRGGNIFDDGVLQVRYHKEAPKYVPPTMREIMEHLLKGGWVRHADYSNADYYYKMAATGELDYCFKRHDSNIIEPWKEKQSGISRYTGDVHQFHLIQPGEWFEGEGK